jgi:hypothetical protein
MNGKGEQRFFYKLMFFSGLFSPAAGKEELRRRAVFRANFPKGLDPFLLPPQNIHSGITEQGQIPASFPPKMVNGDPDYFFIILFDEESSGTVCAALPGDVDAGNAGDIAGRRAQADDAVVFLPFEYSRIERSLFDQMRLPR